MERLIEGTRLRIEVSDLEHLADDCGGKITVVCPKTGARYSTVAQRREQKDCTILPHVYNRFRDLLSAVFRDEAVKINIRITSELATVVILVEISALGMVHRDSLEFHCRRVRSLPLGVEEATALMDEVTLLRSQLALMRS